MSEHVEAVEDIGQLPDERTPLLRRTRGTAAVRGAQARDPQGAFQEADTEDPTAVIYTAPIAQLTFTN